MEQEKDEEISEIKKHIDSIQNPPHQSREYCFQMTDQIKIEYKFIEHDLYAKISKNNIFWCLAYKRENEPTICPIYSHN